MKSKVAYISLTIILIGNAILGVKLIDQKKGHIEASGITQNPSKGVIFGTADECKNAPSQKEFLKLNAEAGHEEAQYRLAWSYASENNLKESFKWLLKSAEQGHMLAQ